MKSQSRVYILKQNNVTHLDVASENECKISDIINRCFVACYNAKKNNFLCIFFMNCSLHLHNLNNIQKLIK